MTSWTGVEEQNFQELIHRAEQQSREYYVRSGAAPSYPRAERVAPPPPPLSQPTEYREVIYLPAPTCDPQPEPPKSRPAPNRKQSLPQQPAGNRKQPLPQQSAGNRKQPPTQLPTGNQKQPSPQQASGKGIAGILGGLDTETLLLCGLAWLLWQENADYKILLALAYILLV